MGDVIVALRDPVVVGKQVAPSMMADDVVVCVAGAETGGESCEKSVVDDKGFGEPFPRNLEAVGEEVVGVTAGVFPAEGTVWMNKWGCKADSAFDCALEFLRRAEAVELGQEADGECVVARVASFVFLKPAFRVLPLHDPLESSCLELVPAVRVEKAPRLF